MECTRGPGRGGRQEVRRLLRRDATRRASPTTTATTERRFSGRAGSAVAASIEPADPSRSTPPGAAPGAVGVDDPGTAAPRTILAPSSLWRGAAEALDAYEVVPDGSRGAAAAEAAACALPSCSLLMRSVAVDGSRASSAALPAEAWGAAPAAGTAPLVGALAVVPDERSTFPTSRPTRPRVVNATPAWRTNSGRGEENAPRTRRQPDGRSRATSAGVSWKSRGRVAMGGGAAAVARASAIRSSWRVQHSAQERVRAMAWSRSVPARSPAASAATSIGSWRSWDVERTSESDDMGVRRPPP